MKSLRCYRPLHKYCGKYGTLLAANFYDKVGKRLIQQHHGRCKHSREISRSYYKHIFHNSQPTFIYLLVSLFFSHGVVNFDLWFCLSLWYLSPLLWNHTRVDQRTIELAWKTGQAYLNNIDEFWKRPVHYQIVKVKISLINI